MPVSLYKPAHKREVSASAVAFAHVIDPVNNAHCKASLGEYCRNGYCARHNPNGYADAMAKHVSNVYGTGSIVRSDTFGTRW